MNAEFTIATDWGEFAAGIGAGLMGLLFVIGSGIWIACQLHFERARTTGTVIGADVTAEDREAIVRFTAADGRVVEFTAIGGGSIGRWGYQVGQSVPVRYDPSRPMRARVSTIRGSWLWPSGMLVFGLVFAVLGADSAVQELRGQGAGERDLRRQRAALYFPLTASLAQLSACSQAPCGQPAERRVLRTFRGMRWRVVNSTSSSSAVVRRLEVVQEALRDTRGDRRRIGPALQHPMNEVYEQIIDELCRPGSSVDAFCDLVIQRS